METTFTGLKVDWKCVLWEEVVILGLLFSALTNAEKEGIIQNYVGKEKILIQVCLASIFIFTNSSIENYEDIQASPRLFRFITPTDSKQDCLAKNFITCQNEKYVLQSTRLSLMTKDILLGFELSKVMLQA